MRNKYAISSQGRAASYKEDVLADRKLLNGSLTSGYRSLNLRLNDGSTTLYLHREVAKLFNPKSSPKLGAVGAPRAGGYSRSAPW